MKYSELCELYESLSKTSKRLEKIEILSNFLRKVSEKDSLVLHLIYGKIYPEYDERKIGISSQLAIKAISKATGIDSRKIIEKWKNIGDLGEVSKSFTMNKKQTTLHSHLLTTEKVLENLRKLPELEGKGTVEKKIALITELLTSASPLEAKYLIRTLMEDLRIGIQESTIREAISTAFFDKEKETSKKIQEAIDKLNDIEMIFKIAKKKDIKEFDKVSFEAGKPIKVMLAQKSPNIQEGFKTLGKPCAIEYKYDGFRIIIHKTKEKIVLFTRRFEDVTKQFPEVVEYVKEYIQGESFILDSEAVGFDKKTKIYKPFQEISQRIKRKYDIDKLQRELPVEINVFDILYYEGKSLLNEPFEKRSLLIKKIIVKTPYKIIPAKQIITGDERKAEEFYKQALEENQEGIMMKSLNAIYQPGSRVGHMLKVKPEERDYDLVITGAEYGTGKRSGWLSSFIISCKDKDNFLEVGRVGTGIKEKTEEGTSFDELTKLLSPLIIHEDGKNVTVKPKIVISVIYQEIQKSPGYNSGFALRFPRLTSLRLDKPLSEITTLEEIKKDFEKQK